MQKLKKHTFSEDIFPRCWETYSTHAAYVLHYHHLVIFNCRDNFYAKMFLKSFWKIVMHCQNFSMCWRNIGEILRRFTKWQCFLEKHVIIWQCFPKLPQLVTRNKVAYSQEYIFTFVTQIGKCLWVFVTKLSYANTCKIDLFWCKNFPARGRSDNACAHNFSDTTSW